MTAMAELRIEQLLGRRIVGKTGERVGRIEEFRVEKRGAQWMVIGVHVGMAGLLERLDVATKLVLGRKRHGYFVRWDQLDIRDVARPRLTCALGDLERT